MKFAITGNTEKKNINRVLEDLIRFFIMNKIEFYLDNILKKRLKDSKLKNKFAGIKTLIKKSDMIISLGGDGTFLKTARLLYNNNIPILGVNLGKLGFMAEVSPEDVIKFITNVLKNNYKVHELCLISASHKSKKLFSALNEIVIDKCDSIRMIELEIFYKNETIGRFFADGVLVSTPTGSTGYSLSAGGPIISPYSKVFIVTPICPHTLNFRPVIVPDDGTIKVKSHNRGKVRITADGLQSIVFKTPSEFQLEKAAHTIKIVKKVNKTYFQTLNHKLLWSADVRKVNH